MKNKILWILGGLAFAAFMALNINTGLENNDPVDVTLDEVESQSASKTQGELDGNYNPMYGEWYYCSTGEYIDPYGYRCTESYTGSLCSSGAKPCVPRCATALGYAGSGYYPGYPYPNPCH